MRRPRGPARPQSPLARYKLDNASRGLLRSHSLSSIEQSLWDLVMLFNAAELLADGICHGPFDVNGLLAIACLPQGDECLHTVGSDDNPA